MSEALGPTLEDLRDVPEAAWLWDGIRARIVWANAAGLAWFGSASLFELVDRPFDFSEPGVERICQFARHLRRGQVERVLLQFPSAGSAAPIDCTCMVHALPDGRSGILVVAAGAVRQPGATAPDILAAFDVLPQGALLAGRDGAIHHLNAAALLMLGATQRGSLEAVLGDSGAADDILARTAAAGTVSLVRPVTIRIGSRDLRITARRMGGAGQAFALVLLDDVTERRALEQRAVDVAMPVAAKPAPVEPLSDAELFTRLGEELKKDLPPVPAPAAKEASAAAPPEQASKPADKPVASAVRRLVPAIPDVMRAPIDRMVDAVMIAKDGQLLHANPAALNLLGLETVEALINDPKLWDRFGPLGQSLPPSDIETSAGRTVLAAVHMTLIPWLSGPARQFTLKPVEKAKADSVALSVVPLTRRRSDTETTAPTPQAAPTVEPEPQAPAPVAREPEPKPAPVAVPEAEVAPAAEARQPVIRSADIITLPPRRDAPEADEELRAILDTAADGIITLDADAKVHTFSAGAEAIFGYRIAEVAGQPFAQLLAPESRKVLRDYLAALQGPGLASVFNDGREVQAIVKQGGTVPLFLTVGRLQAPKSQAAFCAVVRDITQWKKTETELRQAKEAAEATSRQKSEFLARISHELRTPLNAIMGFSDVMRLERFGEIDNAKYKGYVNDIHASGGHLLSLINDLLDLSKVEAGKLELNFTSVNLGDVTDHALRMLQEQAATARVVLRKAFPPGLPNVVADLRSMRQIVINLLSNALKFTDPGGQVIVSAQLMPKGELVLRVKDTGIGMTPDQVRMALEPFQRVVTQGRDVPGTGLGLPLTKALAEANRASFGITSEPRKGTLVEVAFPTPRVLAE